MEDNTMVELNGCNVAMKACVELMDDEIREDMNSEMSGCTAQEFVNEYCKRHEAKYGETFEI